MTNGYSEEGRSRGALLLVLEGLDKAFTFLSCLALFVLMVLISVDVAGRYIFNSPIEGVYEIVELYLMPMIVFLGFGLLQRIGGHVRILLIFEHFNEKTKRLLDVIFLASALAVFGVATVAAGYLAVDHLLAGRMEGGPIPLPLGPSWAIVVLGLGLFCLRLAVQLALCLLGKEYIERQEAHAE